MMRWEWSGDGAVLCRVVRCTGMGWDGKNLLGWGGNGADFHYRVTDAVSLYSSNRRGGLVGWVVMAVQSVDRWLVR